MKRTDISRLQKNRSIYLKLGFIVALSFVILAFNYTTEYQPYEAPVQIDKDVLEEIPVVRTAEKKKPLPPPPSVVAEEIILEDTPEFIEEPLPEPIKTSVDIQDIPEDPITQPVVEPVKPPIVLPPEEEQQYDELVFFAEEMPRFPGCEENGSKEEKKACATDKLLKYIYKQIQYPAIARHNQIEGTVVIGFVIEKDGSLSNVEILREIGGGCGREAARVVKSMPIWIPGKQNGRTVRVQYRLPIKYKLK